MPTETECQVCGKQIYLASGDIKKSIHFDHRHEGKAPIKISPSIYLNRNMPDEKKIDLWKACDFGYLCWTCNRRLPTKNRKQWIEDEMKWLNCATQYLNGEIDA